MSITPVDIVQRQLDAYNARDLEGFLSVFADDAQAMELGAAPPSLDGKAQFRARYGELFARSPRLHGKVITRTCLANVVVDLEHITGRHGSTGVYEVLAIYEITGDLISRVHFVRKP